MKKELIKDLFIMEIFTISLWTLIDAIIDEFGFKTKNRIIISFIFVILLTFYIFKYM